MKSVLNLLLFLSIVSCSNLQRRTGAGLIGHWRYTDELQSCDYSFKANGSFTGEVKLKSKTVSKFTGRWRIKDNALLYTYLNDAFGRIPAGATDRDQLLEIKGDSFLIQAANGDQRRYRRVK